MTRAELEGTGIEDRRRSCFWKCRTHCLTLSTHDSRGTRFSNHRKKKACEGVASRGRRRQTFCSDDGACQRCRLPPQSATRASINRSTQLERVDVYCCRQRMKAKTATYRWAQGTGCGLGGEGERRGQEKSLAGRGRQVVVADDANQDRRSDCRRQSNRRRTGLVWAPHQLHTSFFFTCRTPQEYQSRYHIKGMNQ